MMITRRWLLLCCAIHEVNLMRLLLMSYTAFRMQVTWWHRRLFFGCVKRIAWNIVWILAWMSCTIRVLIAVGAVAAVSVVREIFFILWRWRCRRWRWKHWYRSVSAFFANRMILLHQFPIHQSSIDRTARMGVIITFICVFMFWRLIYSLIAIVLISIVADIWITIVSAIVAICCRLRSLTIRRMYRTVDSKIYCWPCITLFRRRTIAGGCLQYAGQNIFVLQLIEWTRVFVAIRLVIVRLGHVFRIDTLRILTFVEIVPWRITVAIAVAITQIIATINRSRRCGCRFHVIRIVAIDCIRIMIIILRWLPAQPTRCLCQKTKTNRKKNDRLEHSAVQWNSMEHCVLCAVHVRQIKNKIKKHLFVIMAVTSRQHLPELLCLLSSLDYTTNSQFHLNSLRDNTHTKKLLIQQWNWCEKKWFHCIAFGSEMASNEWKWFRIPVYGRALSTLYCICRSLHDTRRVTSALNGSAILSTIRPVCRPPFAMLLTLWSSGMELKQNVSFRLADWIWSERRQRLRNFIGMKRICVAWSFYNSFGPFFVRLSFAENLQTMHISMREQVVRERESER